MLAVKDFYAESAYVVSNKAGVMRLDGVFRVAKVG